MTTKPVARTQGTRQVSYRRMFLAGTALMGITAPAVAADLPVAKALPPPVIAASWAGFYLGVHGGYGWKQDEFSQSEANLLVTPQSINGIRSQGGVYGAQAGYNWQFGRAVTGLEIDFSATDIKGSNSVREFANLGGGATSTASVTLGENVKYLGAARARFGWLPADNVLLYGTAGVAWERLDATQDTSQVRTPAPDTAIFSSRTPTDKFGWVAGVGVEMMLGNPNWVGRLEYLHYDLGQVQTAVTSIVPGGAADISTAGSQRIDVVRAGISYKFGDAAKFASVPYVKAPAGVASPAAWAGFYIGAHGGYGWGDNLRSIPAASFGLPGGGTIGGTRSAGWAAGGHFGHNWQYDRFVTGLEADLGAADIKGASNIASFEGDGSTSTVGFDEKVKYLGTLRGRLGWSPTDSVLLYGTAGLAWERFELAQTFTQTGPGGTSSARFVTPTDHFGWAAGVGAEVMLGSSNWIGRLEYLHYDFGRINPDGSFFVDRPGNTLAGTITAGHQTIDLVRAGVSYKFGPDGQSLTAAPAVDAKAPRMPVSLQGWAGFYIGAHGGYGCKENDFSTVVTATIREGGIKSRGWLGGGQAGYNWQYAKVVAGLEIDGSATGIKGSSIPVTAGGQTDTLSDNVKYLGSMRGRLGWTPAPGWLLYGTGGLAFEHSLRNFAFVSTGGAAQISATPRDLFGWVAGVGVETFIGTSNWIARAEYLHYDFGTIEQTDTSVSTFTGDFSRADKGGRQTIDTVRAGVSYKFTP